MESRTCKASQLPVVLQPVQFLLSHSRSSLGMSLESVRELKFPGDHTARVTPVPIPNTEVKPRRADDTARATVWERRSSPGLKSKGRLEQSRRPFCFWQRCAKTLTASRALRSF